MGFKRVRDKDIHEIVFAAYIPEIEKSKFIIYFKCITNILAVYTFARVFINAQSHIAYYKAFEALFRLISSKLEHEIRWKHLHSSGWTCIVTDMDRGQLQGNIFQIDLESITNRLGWGLYLSSIDPERRSWEWQVQNTVILCSIHFKRSIDRAAGTAGHTTTSIHARMGELARCQSREDYFKLCDELIGTFPIEIILNVFRIGY